MVSFSGNGMTLTLHHKSSRNKATAEFLGSLERARRGGFFETKIKSKFAFPEEQGQIYVKLRVRNICPMFSETKRRFAPVRCFFEMSPLVLVLFTFSFLKILKYKKIWALTFDFFLFILPLVIIC